MAVLYQNLQYSEACYNEVVLFMGPSKTQDIKAYWLAGNAHGRKSLFAENLSL